MTSGSYKHTPEHNKRIGLALIGKKRPYVSIHNSQTKMKSNPSYKSLHEYMRIHHPPPQTCPNCGMYTKLDLACVTGVYDRDFNNYEYLCHKCHKKYDSYRRRYI